MLTDVFRSRFTRRRFMSLLEPEEGASGGFFLSLFLDDIGQNLQTEIRYGIMIISPTKQVHGQKWPNHSTTREMLSVWRYGIKPA